jgi:hypothetical protein
MNDICNSPIYIRLGDRMRAPQGFHKSTVSDIRISHVSVTDADSRYACLIAGVEGHPVRNVRIEDLSVQFRNPLTLEDVRLQRGRNPFFIPEARAANELGEANYPEPSAHGIQTASCFVISDAKDITLKDIGISFLHPDERPKMVLTNTGRVTIERFSSVKDRQIDKADHIILDN